MSHGPLEFSTINLVIIILTWKVHCSDQSSDKWNCPYVFKHDALKINAWREILSMVFVRVLSPHMHFCAWFTDELPTLGTHSNKNTCIIEVRTLETALASATRLKM